MTPDEEVRMRNTTTGAGVLATIVLVSSIMICLNRNRDSDAFTWFVSLLVSIFFAPIYLPYAIIKCGGEAYLGDGTLFKTSCFAPPVQPVASA